MLWQDYVIMCTSVLFSAALVPQVIYGFKEKKGLITYGASVPTFIGLYILSITYITLSLYLSSIIIFITGTLWFILFIQRILYTKA